MNTPPCRHLHVASRAKIIKKHNAFYAHNLNNQNLRSLCMPAPFVPVEQSQYVNQSSSPPPPPCSSSTPPSQPIQPPAMAPTIAENIPAMPVMDTITCIARDARLLVSPRNRDNRDMICLTRSRPVNTNSFFRAYKPLPSVILPFHPAPTLPLACSYRPNMYTHITIMPHMNIIRYATFLHTLIPLRRVPSIRPASLVCVGTSPVSTSALKKIKAPFFIGKTNKKKKKKTRLSLHHPIHLRVSPPPHPHRLAWRPANPSAVNSTDAQ